MKKTATIPSLLLVALAFCSCGTRKYIHGCEYPDLKENTRIESGTKNIEVTKPKQTFDNGYLILSDVQRGIVDGNNQMAFELFKKTASFDSRVVSPLSVSYLLGMLVNGTDGTTRQEILRMMGCENVSIGDLNDFFKMLLGKSGTLDKSTTLNIANYIAVNKAYHLKERFVNTVSMCYEAGVENLDFTKSSTTTRINNWCKKNTNGMIPSIIDSVDPAAISYVMNSVFFNGVWKDKFNKKETTSENFYATTKDVEKVKMMHRNGECQYYANENFAAIDLPYCNGTYQMTVLLPSESKSVDDVLSGLDAKSFAGLKEKMGNYIVDIKLPKFTTEMELSLNDAISQLGAPSIFSPNTADFSSFTETPAYVSKMLQKAKIEVSEEGTKAAAVTSTIMVATSYNPDEPQHVTFHANRPFLYLLTEQASGTIYFIGQFMGK